jgi:hypothetical protein
VAERLEAEEVEHEFKPEKPLKRENSEHRRSARSSKTQGKKRRGS